MFAAGLVAGACGLNNATQTNEMPLHDLATVPDSVGYWLNTGRP